MVKNQLRELLNELRDSLSSVDKLDDETMAKIAAVYDRLIRDRVHHRW